MIKRLNHLFLITSLFVTSLATPHAWSADNCQVGGPNFTSTSAQYHETFLDLERQVNYAKKNAVREALTAVGLDPMMVDFIPVKSLQGLAQSAVINTQIVTQVARAHGYHPTRALPDSPILTFATQNAKAKGQTPVAPATHTYEIEGVKLTVDVQDYSRGTFKPHPSVDMNAHPHNNSYAKLDQDVMIDRALGEYKQANQGGVPLSTGDNPVFYRVVSKAELAELLGTGQARANGSITEWSRDFVTPLEKKWLTDRKIYENGLRALSRPDMGKRTPSDIAGIQADFKAQFGRDLPMYFETQVDIKKAFVSHLKNGLARETSSPGSKERLPSSTKDLMQRFTHNGVLDEAALGRHIEDKILSMPAGSKRNDALLDLYGYDYSAYLHAEYVPGFDQYSPFKGTSIGLPMSDYINKDTYLIAIRDVHGRARKNLGNGGEREWFYKDGIALDEVAGVWSAGDLDTVTNGNIMKKSPDKVRDQAWSEHVRADYKSNINGDPEPIIRP